MADVGKVIGQHKAIARGATTLGYGESTDHIKGSGNSTQRTPGYKAGGSVAKHHGSDHHSGVHSTHSNMHGGLDGTHHESHKSHGHGEGVHHTKTGGKHTSKHGPSNNQFGEHMPHGGTLKKW